MVIALKRKKDNELIDIIKGYEKEVEKFELMWSSEPGWHERLAEQNSLHRKIHNASTILMSRGSKLYISYIKEKFKESDELDQLLDLNNRQLTAVEYDDTIRTYKREKLDKIHSRV